MTWIKLCGCRHWSDVRMVAEAGADAFGMIFAPSPRRISWENARAIARQRPPIAAVAVFVDPSPQEVDAVRELFPDAFVQFSGREPVELVRRYGDRAIKAIHVGNEDAASVVEESCASFDGAMILFDTKDDVRFGGTGRAFSWGVAAPIAARRRVVIAGGLDPTNVAQCVRTVRPYGVDVCSGVECEGRKDGELMRSFVRAVRDADAA
jgi:phosphoribosylanthranilate isomerase